MIATDPLDHSQCYSCKMQTDRDERVYHQGQWKVEAREYLYERCVEVIEALQGGGPFSISEAWRADPHRGPTSYGMMRNVVKDLVLHGLIVCVKPDRSGKCRAYDFVSDRAPAPAP